MQLENHFTVPVPVDEAWRVLLDVQRVAPCMPGATLTSVEGDEFKGNVKVKVGPIMLTYQGHARFKDRDDEGHSVVIEASGKETRGPGTAAATVLTRLVDRGGATEVHVVTDLAVTGKPAQFGRGVMADVSSKLIDRFASCLAAEVRSGSSTVTPTTVEARPAESPTAESPAGEPAPAPAVPPPPAATHNGHPHLLQHEHPHLEQHPRAAEAIDLLETAGLPIAKRLVPLLAAVAGVVLLIRWRLRR